MLLANEKGTFVIDRFFNFFQVDSSRLYLPQLNALDKPHTKVISRRSQFLVCLLFSICFRLHVCLSALPSLP